MLCTQCGAAFAPGVNFCPRCGTVVASPAPSSYTPPPVYSQYSAPMVMRRPRVQSHLQTLGILWCVFAAYRILTALVSIFAVKIISHGGFGGGRWPFGYHFYDSWGQNMSWMSGLIPVIIATTAVMTGLAALVGYSLLTRQSWGRTLAIIAAVLALFKIPFGTAMGIYTLWVLAPAQSGAEYEALVELSPGDI